MSDVVKAARLLATYYPKLGPVEVAYDEVTNALTMSADGRSVEATVPPSGLGPGATVKVLGAAMKRLWGGRRRSRTAVLRFVDRKQLPQDQWERDGKPQWRHMLRIEFTKDEAWRTVQHLISQLSEDEPEPYAVLCGELRRMRDE